MDYPINIFEILLGTLYKLTKKMCTYKKKSLLESSIIIDYTTTTCIIVCVDYLVIRLTGR